MTCYAALLRAVNVGGTGKLPMADLKRMGEEAGFEAVSTYIASGNLIFRSDLDQSAVRKVLEDRLEAYAGKRVAIHVRTAEELAALVKRNPFPDRQPNRVVAMLIEGTPPADTLDRITGAGTRKSLWASGRFSSTMVKVRRTRNCAFRLPLTAPDEI